jgi:hypothetical protein
MRSTLGEFDRQPAALGIAQPCVIYLPECYPAKPEPLVGGSLIMAGHTN